MTAAPGSPPRRSRLLIIALLWVAIDGLLIRIAAGSGFNDWAHTYEETPLLFIAELVVSAVNLAVVGLILGRPTRPVLLAAAGWGGLVAVLGVLLVAANDTSGSAVTVAAAIAGWLAYGAAGELAPNDAGGSRDRSG